MDASRRCAFEESEQSLPVTLRGLMTVEHALSLQATLRSHAHVIRADVDCSQLEYLDAAILQILLAFDADCRSRGGGIRLKDVPPEVSALLALVGSSIEEASPAEPSVNEGQEGEAPDAAQGPEA